MGEAAADHKSGTFLVRKDARVAQLVEQRIENPRVGGSSPPPGTTFLRKSMVALNHSFCRLLSINMSLWPEMAICHSKSDPRVTEE